MGTHATGAHERERKRERARERARARERERERERAVLGYFITIIKFLFLSTRATHDTNARVNEKFI